MYPETHLGWSDAGCDLKLNISNAITCSAMDNSVSELCCEWLAKEISHVKLTLCSLAN